MIDREGKMGWQGYRGQRKERLQIEEKNNG